METGASIGNVHQGWVTTGRVALGSWREIVRMGLCGRHGLWHLARWAVRYFVWGLRGCQYGRRVMRERPVCGRLVMCRRLLANRMHCKGFWDRYAAVVAGAAGRAASGTLFSRGVTCHAVVRSSHVLCCGGAKAGTWAGLRALGDALTWPLGSCPLLPDGHGVGARRARTLGRGVGRGGP